jgi:thiosulfate reductase cytochrome b subunit
MTAIKLSNKRVRDLQRAVHLLGGLLVMASIYPPLAGRSMLDALVQFVVIPVLVVTGLAMWQAPRLRRLLARLRPAAPTHQAGASRPHVASDTDPTA